MQDAIRIIAGLGNPGPRYADTRHNAGFMLADAVAEQCGAGPWKAWRGLGDYTRISHAGRECWLVKPMTFMNDSGRMVRAFSDYYGIKPAEIMVCYDDLSLDLGALRIRQSGSGGGHQGMENVVAAMGTAAIPRLRLGIGPQPVITRGGGAVRMRSEDFVLAPFPKAARPELETMISNARGAAALAVGEGVAAAMNRYNARA